ncbi:MAG: hypothetical protein ACKV1O_11810 [Saprospiraceae bacterium]
MKNLFKILGGLCLFLALIFFLYGSMRTASGEEKGKNEVDMGDGIILVEKNTEQQFGDYGFNLAAILGIGGIVLLLLGRSSERRI